MAKKPTKRSKAKRTHLPGKQAHSTKIASHDARKSLLGIDGKKLRKEARTSTLPHAAAWTAEAQELVEANARNVARDIVARPAAYGFKSVYQLEGELVAASVADLYAMIIHAFHAGFSHAMRKHRTDLETTADAAVIVGGQRRGHKHGHDSQRKRAERRANEIRDTWAKLEAEGKKCTYDAVASIVGFSRSTVERAINERKTKRKKR